MKAIEKFAVDIGLSQNIIENYITYSDKYYVTHYLKKKSGNKRIIHAPGKNLKTIQRFILRKYLNKIEVSKRATGFVKKKGIKQNAMFHLDKKFVLTLDIKDFFPSISQKKVFVSLEKHFSDKNFALKIAKICTYKRRLPQGSPTSPSLSNIVFSDIDRQIIEYCNSELINYSRYADDLSFSSDNKNSLRYVYSFVNKLLLENGFRINKEKTRYLSGKGPILITGLSINEGTPKASRKLKRNIRSDIYKHFYKGEEINLNRLAGQISFVSSIEKDYEKKIGSYIVHLKTKKKMESL